MTVYVCPGAHTFYPLRQLAQADKFVTWYLYLLRELTQTVMCNLYLCQLRELGQAVMFVTCTFTYCCVTCTFTY